jgi:hypothetical protein
MKLKFLTLNLKYLLRGFLIAFLPAVIIRVINIMETGAVFTEVTVRSLML